MSDWEQAKGYYLKAVGIEPGFADAHKGLAVVFYRLEQYESALRHLEKAGQLGADVDEGLRKAIKRKL